jgi:hypothetical protein
MPPLRHAQPPEFSSSATRRHPRHQDTSRAAPSRLPPAAAACPPMLVNSRQAGAAQASAKAAREAWQAGNSRMPPEVTGARMFSPCEGSRHSHAPTAVIYIIRRDGEYSDGETPDRRPDLRGGPAASRPRLGMTARKVSVMRAEEGARPPPWSAASARYRPFRPAVRPEEKEEASEAHVSREISPPAKVAREREMQRCHQKKQRIPARRQGEGRRKCAVTAWRGAGMAKRAW